MSNSSPSTVLEKIVDQVRRARRLRKPLICIATHDVRVILDVLYHPDNPVAPVGLVKRRNLSVLDLLEGENAPRNAENILWYSSASEQERRGFPQFDIPRITVFQIRANAATIDPGHLKPLSDFADAYARETAPQSYMLIYGDVSALPADLAARATIIDMEYPDALEIRSLIRKRAVPALHAESDQAVAALEKRIGALTEDLRGFTYTEIDDLVRYLIDTESAETRLSVFWDDDRCKQEIASEKQQALKRNGGLLELILPDDSISLHGMERFERWIREKIPQIRNVRRYMSFVGVPSLKGVLLNGVPGCGKSEAALLLQKEWKLPLIKMDIGSLMGGLLGQSERQMRDALRQIEACSPCIFWIDEIEKGLAGASGGANSDNTSLMRMFSYLLTWLGSSRGSKVCFAYITANSLRGLPPELTRTGRVDNRFSVSMPTERECIAIFRAQIAMAGERARKARAEAGLNAEWSILSEPVSDEKLRSLISADENSLLNPGNGRKPLFVNGADICKIVCDALAACLTGIDTDSQAEGTDPDAMFPIHPDRFIQNAKKVISGGMFASQGYGAGNLMQLADVTLRTMRGSFVPCSDAPLFIADDYDETYAESGGVKARTLNIADNPPDGSPYDAALYRALREQMLNINPQTL